MNIHCFVIYFLIIQISKSLNAQRLSEMTPLRGSGRPGESDAGAAWPQPFSSLLRGWTKPLACTLRACLPQRREPGSRGNQPLRSPSVRVLSPEPHRGCPRGPAQVGRVGRRQRQAGREGTQEAGATGGAGALTCSHPSTGGLPSAPAPRPGHVSSPLEFNFGCTHGLSSCSQKKNYQEQARLRTTHGSLVA